MGVKVVFLLDCPLVLSLLKHRTVKAFLNKKKNEDPKQGSLLNSKVIFSNNFCFLFSKTCFWEYKGKKKFSCNFLNKKMFG